MGLSVVCGGADVSEDAGLSGGLDDRLFWLNSRA